LAIKIAPVFHLLSQLTPSLIDGRAARQTAALRRKNQSVITAKHYRRSATAHAWDVETRRFGTPRAAALWAGQVLAGQDIVTTAECYSRDVSRASSVTLHRDGVQVEEILPPVHVHLSIGERGY
jgi:hypothetical protein